MALDVIKLSGADPGAKYGLYADRGVSLSLVGGSGAIFENTVTFSTALASTPIMVIIQPKAFSAGTGAASRAHVHGYNTLSSTGVKINLTTIDAAGDADPGAGKTATQTVDILIISKD